MQQTQQHERMAHNRSLSIERSSSSRSCDMKTLLLANASSAAASLALTQCSALLCIEAAAMEKQSTREGERERNPHVKEREESARLCCC